jgi:hypothetical protein
MRKQKPPRFYTPIHPGKTRAAPPRKNQGVTTPEKPGYFLYLSVLLAEQGGAARPARAATGRAEPATGRHRAGAEPLSDTTQSSPFLSSRSEDVRRSP